MSKQLKPKYDASKLSEVEELLVLVQHRAKPHGENTAKGFFPGEIYKQSGLDKAQVLMTNYCTLDLDAVVPPNTKRKAPEKGHEKFINPVDVLSAKIDKLVDIIAAQYEGKKK